MMCYFCTGTPRLRCGWRWRLRRFRTDCRGPTSHQRLGERHRPYDGGRHRNPTLGHMGRDLLRRAPLRHVDHREDDFRTIGCNAPMRAPYDSPPERRDRVISQGDLIGGARRNDPKQLLGNQARENAHGYDVLSRIAGPIELSAEHFASRRRSSGPSRHADTGVKSVFLYGRRR